MIQVTRLNGSTFVLNCELIEAIEATPDTVVTLVNDHRYVVIEAVDEVIELVVSYKRRIHRL